MIDPAEDIGYPIFVSRHNDEFELGIWELLLFVRAPTLQEAYALLRERKERLAQLARGFDSISNLPPPSPAPALSGPRPKSWFKKLLAKRSH